MANEVTPANEIKFEKLCNLFEQLHRKKKQKQEQDKILGSYINDFKLTASQIVGPKVITILYQTVVRLVSLFAYMETAASLFLHHQIE